MKYILYVLLLLSLNILNSQENGEWVLKQDENNIKIYTRNIDSSSFKEFKAVSIFDSSFDELLQQLYEAPAYTENTEYNISYLIDTPSKEGRYFYYKQSLPWPILNRDVVTKLTLTKETDSAVLLSIESVSGIIDLEDKTTRITDLSGFWLLEKVQEGIQVTQQIHVDPGGRVPPFIVNPLLVKGPYKTFTELHSKLDTNK